GVLHHRDVPTGDGGIDVSAPHAPEFLVVVLVYVDPVVPEDGKAQDEVAGKQGRHQVAVVAVHPAQQGRGAFESTEREHEGPIGWGHGSPGLGSYLPSRVAINSLDLDVVAGDPGLRRAEHAALRQVVLALRADAGAGRGGLSSLHGLEAPFTLAEPGASR